MLNNVYLYNNENEVVGVKTKRKKEVTLSQESIYELKKKTYDNYDNYLLGKNLVASIKEKVVSLPDMEEIKITIDELDQKIYEYNKLVKDQKKKNNFILFHNNKYSLINQKEFEYNLERCAGYVYSYLRRNDIIEV